VCVTEDEATGVGAELLPLWTEAVGAVRDQVVLASLDRLATDQGCVNEGVAERQRHLLSGSGGENSRAGGGSGNGLLSGKVAVASGAVPSGWTGPTMVWLTACDPTGQGPEVTDCMGVVSVPDAGVIVRVPSEPVGTLAPATPFASNTDPAMTAATTAPDTSRVNIFFLRTM
jgi:hypothetical protein